MKITIVGSIIADFVVTTDRFPRPGETINGKSSALYAGGKGANQATACARLGGEAIFVGCVGADYFGDMLLGKLAQSGIDARRVKRVKDIGTGVALILLDAAAENTIIVTRGANDALKPEDVDRCANEIRASKALLLQMEVPEPVVLRAMRIARAHGVPVIFDPAPAHGVTRAVLKLADYILPNRQETRHLTGIDPSGKSGAEKAAKAFRKMGIPRSIVKMGADGCFVSTPEGTEYVPAFRVKAVDTVGAGDCFAGAFTCGLVKGLDPVEAARFASAAAAIKVTRRGAQDGIPRLAEVKRFMRRCHPRN